MPRQFRLGNSTQHMLTQKNVNAIRTAVPMPDSEGCLQSRPGVARVLELFVDHEHQPVGHAPENGAPGGPVPETAENHGDHQVPVSAGVPGRRTE
ncbi:MAG: hypothetical protein U0792_12155 [Gemmataceae bacterium]